MTIRIAEGMHHGGRGDQLDSLLLGKWLSKKKGVLLERAHFEQAGERQGAALWRLENADGLM